MKTFNQWLESNVTPTFTNYLKTLSDKEIDIEKKKIKDTLGRIEPDVANGEKSQASFWKWYNLLMAQFNALDKEKTIRDPSILIKRANPFNRKH